MFSEKKIFNDFVLGKHKEKRISLIADITSKIQRAK